MRTIRILLALLTLPALIVTAQEIDVDTPTGRTPKVPEAQPSSAFELERPQSPRSPGGDREMIPGLKINGIIIVDEQAQIQQGGVEPPESGVEVRGIPLLQTPEFISAMRAYLGRPVTENTIRDMQDEIILYCRERAHPLIDVFLKEQDISNGVLQLWFVEGRVGSVTVDNPGRRWFSDELLTSQMRVGPGDTVDSGELTEDLLWLNRNPFRQVGLLYTQGTNVGYSDLVLQVEDRIPLRGYAGYEDSGTVFTGEDRLFAGFNYGNAWGRDHQVNYQYTTDFELELLKAHSASYVAPLPWRHTLTLSGAYVDAKVDASEVDPDSNTEAEGESILGGLRYAVPLPQRRNLQHELTAGFDYKRSNNDLEFSGTSQAVEDSEVLQFQLGYSLLLSDAHGQTTFGAEGFYSPGGLTDRNDDEFFESLRSGATADYAYGRVTAERITRLPWDYSWILTGVGQYASDRLLPSEQIGVGGYRSVRGYDERLANGDHGWIVSNEIRTRGFETLNFFPGGVNTIQFLVFADYGATRIEGDVDEGSDVEADLFSVGGGLRYTVGLHVSFRFDYGFQLYDRELSDDIRQPNSRGHLGLMVSF